VRTKGQLEADIGDAIAKFEKEYMGRGPLETSTYIVEDMVIVRLRGVLTPAETHLAKGRDPARSRQLIKEVRSELLEGARTLLEAIVKDITGHGVISLHTDVSTTVGERMIIFTLDGAPVCEDRET
jgi:uncharacterized protein YbcI